MKFLLFIFISLLTINSEALEVKKENGRIIITDFSCSKVEKVVRDLETWTKNSDENKSCPINKKAPNSSFFKCSYDITDCIPNHVVKYQGINPEMGGPNCWNLALVMSDILPALRFSPPKEMTFYMQSPLCRSLKNGEERIPGDIGAIRNIGPNGLEEVHGFIYISDDIAYSKNGANKKTPYALQPLNTVYETYNVPDLAECKQNRTFPGEKCAQAMSFYRCMSMEEYLKKNPEVSIELQKGIKDLNNFESCLELHTISNAPLSKNIKNTLEDTMTVLGEYIKQEAAERKMINDPKYRFLLGSIKVRIDSIASQLYSENKDDLEYLLEFYRFTDSIRYSRDE
jgi:hypothetical protein